MAITGPALLWETMVFGKGGIIAEQKRYACQEDAVAGHKRIVKRFGRKP
jgi:hypothetical protein